MSWLLVVDCCLLPIPLEQSCVTLVSLVFFIVFGFHFFLAPNDSAACACVLFDVFIRTSNICHPTVCLQCKNHLNQKATFKTLIFGDG